MLSLLCFISLLISVGNSCSIALPVYGTYYISQAQLLDADMYPDSILLTIVRQNYDFDGSASSRLSFVDPTGGPWCKIMDVNDGSVGDVVNCTMYEEYTRDYSSVDTTSTTVVCDDNCDGATATCNITRSGVEYSITDIPYAASNNCTDGLKVISIGGIFNSFTINDISTTYIIFSTNSVGVVFDDTASPATYQIVTVDIEGELSYITPGGWGTGTPSVYSDVNVLQIPLPCCLCFGWSLSTYEITSDPTGVYDQIFTITSLTSGGNVDTIKERAISIGLGYGNTVTIYDLSNGGSSVFQPNLCDVIVDCTVSPCANSTCPYNPTAKCIDDTCGGCNAKWYVLLLLLYTAKKRCEVVDFIVHCLYIFRYCGSWDITTSCDEDPWDYECPTTAPTEDPTTSKPTEEPTTSKPTEDPTTAEPTSSEPTSIPTQDPILLGTPFPSKANRFGVLFGIVASILFVCTY